MAEIRPFKGIRYNQEMLGNPAAVMARPYDVISPEEQELLYIKNPYNIVRLEYGKTYPGDHQTENRYSRASKTIKQWLNEGILQCDESENFYFYEQTFIYNEQEYKRRGIIVALKIEPYSAKAVLPHEKTMAAPKKDRLELLSHSRANFSPVFTLIPDPQQRIDCFFERVAEEKPLLETTEESGQKHRLWAANDPALINDLQGYLADQPLLIADGHHRYETALTYLQSVDPSQLPGARYILTTLVSVYDPGLLMLPTHRLLNKLNDHQNNIIEQKINEHFEVLDRGSPEHFESRAYLAELDKVSREKSGFGYIAEDKICLLIPKAADKSGETASGMALPVKLLHEQILNHLAAADKNQNSDINLLGFSHDFAGSLDSVKSGSADAAFILGTIPVARVLDEARQGAVLPQKSTYFYPKLPSGLVIYHMDLSC